MKKSGPWTTSNIKSLGRRARINKGNWGIAGEAGKPGVCRVHDSSHSRSQGSAQLCLMLVTVQNLQIKYKQNCKASKIRITLIYESVEYYLQNWSLETTWPTELTHAVGSSWVEHTKVIPYVWSPHGAFSYQCISASVKTMASSGLHFTQMHHLRIRSPSTFLFNFL